jgi:hypothetical protein
VDVIDHGENVDEINEQHDFIPFSVMEDPTGP